MSATLPYSWAEANQRHLMSAIASVRTVLEEKMTAVQSSDESSAHESALARPVSAPGIESASPNGDTETLDPPAALDLLCASFGLSPFERDVLLLCAGMELDSTFGALCAAAHGDASRAYPTWGLALAALREPHWSALTPVAPLRRWRLIEIGPGGNLTTSPLRIDERTLHFLAGVSYIDERLAGMVQPLEPPYDLVPSHRQFAARISAAWSGPVAASGLPLMQLLGAENTETDAVAAAACAMLGLKLQKVSANLLPIAAAELEAFVRLWEREAVLTTSALLVDCDDFDFADRAHDQAVTRFIESVRGAVMLSSPTRWNSGSRPCIQFELQPLNPTEQRQIWEDELGRDAAALNGQLDVLVSQFSLPASAIRSACSISATIRARDNSSTDAGLPGRLWDACRAHARPRLDDLAQRIEPKATWEDLVLPELQIQLLRQIATHVRRRARVYGHWGFSDKCGRGLGISTLFAGPSGTGKTMAAEVIANELRLDLYRIDLSQVVNKYIGETEKNLRRIFDCAELGGVILLFDEADALFGKRSEVKDSHDRYSNIEVSYLLQRMEAYRGLAILTSNLKNAMDTAFQRRIRFVVHFPFPDVADRERIWQRIFPPATPVEGLDNHRLARLNVAGGSIRNIALNAAFLAADANEAVGMKHLRCAAQTEYTKIEKPLSDAEIGGWM
jgi:hypothetical protein